MNTYFVDRDKNFYRSKFFHWKVYFKKETIFWTGVNYKLYLRLRIVSFRFILNLKYLRKLQRLFTRNMKLHAKLKIYNLNIFEKCYNKVFEFIYMYNYLLNTIAVDIFYFTRGLKKKKKFHYLIITFKKNKLFINVLNPRKLNIFTLSTGFFIKFFEKKKSFKKNKLLKFLLMKHLRKILLITRIRNLILFVKKTPVLLSELINLFNQPISHKFDNPITKKAIEEVETEIAIFRFPYFIFLESKSFVKRKIKKKGRIERKVLRKVILENKIID